MEPFRAHNQILLEEFIVENEPWLLKFQTEIRFIVTRYLERHSASSVQHVKKLKSLREGLHVMMQCYMRQHFADRQWLHEHPGRRGVAERTHDEEIYKESTTYFARGHWCAD